MNRLSLSKKLRILIDGRQETVYFDKITSRIVKLCYGLNMDYVDPVSLMKLRQRGPKWLITMVSFSETNYNEGYKWFVQWCYNSRIG